MDVHHHFLPDTVISYIRQHGDRVNSEVVKKDGQEYVWDKRGSMFPIYREYYDYEQKIATMESCGIDRAVLSVVPNVYYYWIVSRTAYEIAQMCNNWISDFCSAHSERFSGMASIPMQDPVLALKELRRAHEELKLKAVAIAPIVQNIHLDEQAFFEIYEYCQAQDILIFLHPCFPEGRRELDKYYSINLIGNIYQTTLGINHLIFGGIFARFPKLKVLASHGGGFFPYQAGRMLHGMRVRTEIQEKIQRISEAYFGNIYFDTITHWDASLQFLVEQFDSEHVMLGTDAPFDMGDYQAVARVRRLKLPAEERDNICFKNAANLFALDR